MSKAEIPTIVIKATQSLIKENGGKIKFLGVNNGNEIYLYQPPKDVEIGFPKVFVRDKEDAVIEITTYDAFEYIDLYIKD